LVPGPRRHGPPPARCARAGLRCVAGPRRRARTRPRLDPISGHALIARWKPRRRRPHRWW
jgi:hypothetical protein